MSGTNWPIMKPPHPDAVDHFVTAPELRPLTEDEQRVWRDHLDSLPTVNVEFTGMFDDGASALPKTLILELESGQRYTFDQSHAAYWEIMGSLEIVEE